jgi:hypothetical protein
MNIMKQTSPEQAVFLRATQNEWIKHRDEGLKSLSFTVPEDEKEARRLQFLGDVTAARIQIAPDRWGSPQSWLY